MTSVTTPLKGYAKYCLTIVICALAACGICLAVSAEKAYAADTVIEEIRITNLQAPPPGSDKIVRGYKITTVPSNAKIKVKAIWKFGQDGLVSSDMKIAKPGVKYFAQFDFEADTGYTFKWPTTCVNINNGPSVLEEDIHYDGPLYGPGTWTTMTEDIYVCGNTLPAQRLGTLKKAKKAMTVNWTKAEPAFVDGYQIRYSLKSSMKGAKTMTVKGATKSSAKIKKLKSKKKYYVQIRTYKNANDATYYSAWSGKKSVKTK